MQVSVDITSEVMLNNILDGLWYIEMSSIDYPNGEIRGQITHQDRFYASLSPQNTIPRASGTDACMFSLLIITDNSY